MTGGHLAALLLVQDGAVGTTDVLGERASGMEGTSGRELGGVGRLAAEPDARPTAAAADGGHGRDEGLGVRVAGIPEDLAARAVFDEPARRT